MRTERAGGHRSWGAAVPGIFGLVAVLLATPPFLLASSPSLAQSQPVIQFTNVNPVQTTTSANTPVSVDLASALAFTDPNDGLCSNDPINLSVASPQHGSAAISGTVVTYTPQNGFSGVDSFAYTVSTPGGSFCGPTSASSTISVTVSAPPAPPPVANQSPPSPPNPDQDPTVGATVGSMQNSMNTATQMQFVNFEQRLRELRSGAHGVNIAGLQIGMAGHAFSITDFARRGSPFGTMAENLGGPDERLLRARALTTGSEALRDPGAGLGAGTRAALRDWSARTGDNAGTGAAGSRSGPLQRLSQSSDEPEVELPDRVGVFINGLVNIGRVNGTASSAGSSFTTGGVSFGVDYRFTPNLVLGVGGGFSSTGNDIEGGSKSDNQTFNVTLYGTDRPLDPVYIDGQVSFGSLDFNNKRLVTTTGQIAESKPGGRQVSASLTGGYEFTEGAATIGPYLRLAGGHGSIDSATETGAGTADLSYDSQHVDSVTTTLGLHGDYAISTSFGIVSPYGRVEYEHQFAATNQAATVSFASGTTGFSVAGTPLTRNYFNLGAGVSVLLENALSMFVDYEGLVGDNNRTSHLFTFGLSKRF